MIVTIDVEHVIEDIVYLKTDPEQLPRMITAYTVSPQKVRYELACGAGASWHDAIEISRQKTNQTEVTGLGK